MLRPKPTPFPTLLLTGLLVLVGRGQDVPTPTPKTVEVPAKPSPVPLSDAALVEGARLLAGMRQALISCRGLEAEVQGYSQGRFKDGKPVSELRKDRTRVYLAWQKPQKLYGKVLETTTPFIEGAVMVTVDGRRVRARAKGLLGLVPLDLDATDGLLANNRSHPFSENNPGAHLQRLTGPNAQWRVVGATTQNGAPASVVAVEGVRRLDREVDRELLTLESQTLRVHSLAMYDGDERVLENVFLKCHWNPTVKSDLFKL